MSRKLAKDEEYEKYIAAKAESDEPSREELDEVMQDDFQAEEAD